MPTDELPDDHPLAIAYNRGLELQAGGDVEGAAAAFKEALALDPEDHAGLAFRLATMGHGDLPDMLPPAYVATLFDQNAETFDETLVDKLGYAVPMLVRERVAALELGPWSRHLDLGCGTGLMGASVTDLTEHQTGVDLSENILQEAAERDCYDDLYLGDAVSFLQEGPMDDGPWDLITATDVLPYIGALRPFFDGLGRALATGGTVILSTETKAAAAFDGADWGRGSGYRYAHNPDYLSRLFAEHGYIQQEASAIVVRMDDGEPVPGQLIIAERRAT
ncbi:MAG: methyltransferase [Pseudomonadota bacterium]